MKFQPGYPIILVLILFLTVGSTPEKTSPEQPNIVFVLADDLGIGDVGVYNKDSKIPTPNFDQLANQGMRFTDAHAPGSVCIPSRYGLLTGRHPHREHTEEWRERALIDSDQQNLAKLLKKRGYATYMVGKWHLGFEGGEDYDCSESLRGGPIDNGFDNYFGIPASLDQPPYFYIRDNECVKSPTDTTNGSKPKSDQWTDIQGAFWRAGNKAPDFEHEEVLDRFTEETSSYIRSHIEKNPEKPFFMYMALAAPHTPWLPVDSLRGTSKAGSYGDFVVQVDHTVGRILEVLESLEIEDNTLIVFTSDNGPVWYQKDVEYFGHQSTQVYRGMKSDAWEGGHRVPFIARWPGHVQPGSQSDQLVTLTDMLATFADISGSPIATDSSDGYNILPVMTGDRDSISRNGAVFQSIHYMVVRKGPWKLIPGLGSGGFVSEPNTRKPGPGEPEGQLYNLERDSAELNNLYEERPDVVERLKKQLRRYRRQQPEE